MSSSSLKSRRYVMGVLSAGLSLFGLGCATGSDQVRHGMGAGYWETSMPTLPSRQSPIEAMAFGRGGSAEPASDMGVDAALAALDSRGSQRAVAATNAKLVAAKQAAPVEVAEKREQVVAQPEHAAPSNVTVDQPVLLAENTQESRYASREAQSQDQQKFAGGDAIVITSGAIVLVLLIVLLVLLLR